MIHLHRYLMFLVIGHITAFVMHIRRKLIKLHTYIFILEQIQLTGSLGIKVCYTTLLP